RAKHTHRPRPVASALRGTVRPDPSANRAQLPGPPPAKQYVSPACAARAVVRVRRVRRVRSWLTGLVWISVTLRAELEAKERLAERRQAKLVVQTVHHPHCDHRHHDLQAEMPAFYGQHPERWRGSSLVVA